VNKFLWSESAKTGDMHKECQFRAEIPVKAKVKFMNTGVPVGTDCDVVLGEY